MASGALIAINIGALGIAALTPYVRVGFDFPTWAVGFVLSAVFGGAAVATLLAGAIVIRFQARLSIAIAVALAACGMAIVASAPDLGYYYGGLLLVGAGVGLLVPATDALTAASVGMRRRGVAMSLKQTGVVVGGALGALTLPAIAELAGWRVAVSFPIAACLAVVAWAVAAPRPAAAARVPLAPSVRAPGRAQAPGRATIWAYGFVMGGVQLGVFGYLPVYLVDDRGFTAAGAGLGYFVTLVFGAVGRMAWGVASDRLGTRLAPLAAVALGSSAGLACLAIVPTAALWPVLAFVGLCTAGWNGVYHAAVAESVVQHWVGHASAHAMFFTYAGSILIPPALGVFAEIGQSWTAQWLAACAMVALVALMAVGLASSKAAPSQGIREAG